MTARRLPIRSCRVVRADGSAVAHRTVPCPRRGRSTTFEHCCGCGHRESIEVESDGERGTITCITSGDERSSSSVAEAATRTPLGDVLPIDATCIRGDVPVGVVEQLLVEKQLRAVPVVDDARGLVGIVSKTDLLRSRASRTHRHKRAADVMTAPVHGLPEDAPVTYAISLMASRGLHEVPIVDGAGRVLGMITATDTLRWVAGALGYVVPPR